MARKLRIVSSRPPKVTGGQTQRDANHIAEQRRQWRDAKHDGGTMDHAAEDVAREVVTTQKVVGVRSLSRPQTVCRGFLFFIPDA